MFNIFKRSCKHPFRALRVQKKETIRDSEDYPGEFEVHDYYFRCADCDKLLTIGFSDPVALKAQIDSTFRTMGVDPKERDLAYREQQLDKKLYSRS